MLQENDNLSVRENSEHVMMQDEPGNEIPIQEGRWNDDEHLRFLEGKHSHYEGVMEFGKDWKEVEKVVKTRTGSQVRSHAQKYFIKLRSLQKERKRQKSKVPKEPTII